MPILKSAIKKLRQDRKRTKINRIKKDALKELIKKAKKSKILEAVKKAQSAIDKAAKTHLIHRNKAARLKSRLSKLVKPTPKAATVKKPKKKT
ncbi:30S ribosomal protein S20 [Candidatus Microgenomates bacterium]|nr:30S ribosomal protein S20 [Candidatus Microgenomates bacterium]MBI2622112.1 30S ribosomal protein S20 [Candidatus Microgenomates bacterium]